MIILIIAGSSRSLISFRGQLIQDMINLGHEVHVACPDLATDNATVTSLRELGVPCHDIRLQRNGLNPISDISTLLDIVGILRKIGATVVLAYTIKPVVWGMIGARVCRVERRYALITGLGYAFTSGNGGVRAFIKVTARWLYRLSLRCADTVFFQNQDDKNLFLGQRIIGPEKTTVVVNGSGVNTEHFYQAPIPDGEVSFLLVARLLGDKGIREYVGAAKALKLRYPSCSFSLVGDRDTNPDSIPLSEIREWQLTKAINWLGHSDDVASEIAKCHVFVLPSYREGTPRAVLEAMAMGRPIVTTDAPGCRETVEPGVNGFLVAVKDVEGLISAMERFIAAPETIESMGSMSRRIAIEKYDVHRVNRQMLEEMKLI